MPSGSGRQLYASWQCWLVLVHTSATCAGPATHPGSRYQADSSRAARFQGHFLQAAVGFCQDWLWDTWPAGHTSGCGCIYVNACLALGPQRQSPRASLRGTGGQRAWRACAVSLLQVRKAQGGCSLWPVLCCEQRGAATSTRSLEARDPECAPQRTPCHTPTHGV